MCYPKEKLVKRGRRVCERKKACATQRKSWWSGARGYVRGKKRVLPKGKAGEAKKEGMQERNVMYYPSERPVYPASPKKCWIF